ncbi:unnamed protein product [Colias eurytheme]|nr:unnamed protein product [Colias eurytheme]
MINSHSADMRLIEVRQGMFNIRLGYLSSFRLASGLQDVHAFVVDGSVRCRLQINFAGYRQEQLSNSSAASVYKLKGCYLRLNTPLFPLHFRTPRALPDIAFKVALHARALQIAILRAAPHDITLFALPLGKTHSIHE